MEFKGSDINLANLAYKKYRSYKLNFYGRLIEDKGALKWIFPPRYELLQASDPVFDITYFKLAEYHSAFFQSILNAALNSPKVDFPFNSEEDLDLINDLISNVYLPLIEENSNDLYLVKGYHLVLDAMDDLFNIPVYFQSANLSLIKEKTL